MIERDLMRPAAVIRWSSSWGHWDVIPTPEGPSWALVGRPSSFLTCREAEAWCDAHGVEVLAVGHPFGRSTCGARATKIEP